MEHNPTVSLILLKHASHTSFAVIKSHLALGQRNFIPRWQKSLHQCKWCQGKFEFRICWVERWHRKVSVCYASTFAVKAIHSLLQSCCWHTSSQTWDEAISFGVLKGFTLLPCSPVAEMERILFDLEGSSMYAEHWNFCRALLILPCRPAIIWQMIFRLSCRPAINMRTSVTPQLPETWAQNHQTIICHMLL